MVVEIGISSVVGRVKGSVEGELRSKAVQAEKVHEGETEKGRKEGATSKGQVLRVRFNRIKVGEDQASLIREWFDKLSEEGKEIGEQSA